MRRFLAGLLALVAVVAGLASGEPPATTVTCVTDSHTCTAGSCTGAVPDGGSTTGVALLYVRSYYVRVCAEPGQTLSGAGNLLDYHCRAQADAGCAEVKTNRQPVTKTGEQCEETPTFVIPYMDTTSDRMLWIPSAVTVSGGSTVGVSICPQK